MKFVSIGMVAVLLAACGEKASPDKPGTGPAPLQGTVYGEGVATSLAVQISDLHERIDEFEGQRVRVEGLVTDVCPKRGCWIQLASDKEFQTLTFKVVDGVIVFPMSAKGKYAVADGVARRIELDLERTRKYLAHQAEEKGEPFDPASVTEPLSFVRLDGVGAVIRDRK